PCPHEEEVCDLVSWSAVEAVDDASGCWCCRGEEAVSPIYVVSTEENQNCFVDDVDFFSNASIRRFFHCSSSLVCLRVASTAAISESDGGA
ncbi:hypothetical protein A2U01_0081010, partial [Trifolium medium]|nr:hypothetical protein [Trifolium medium]